MTVKEIYESAELKLERSEISLGEFVKLVDIEVVEPKQSKNATWCYEFLKNHLGEDIVDSKKEFESWFERMVWHVKECNKLAREPKQGEWLFKEITDDYHVTGQCSVCKERRRIDNFCPNCGANMRDKNSVG